MSALQSFSFVQVPLTVEAFQFNGGADQAKEIIERLAHRGDEATWRPAWLDYDTSTHLWTENPEIITIKGRQFITKGDWVIMKPNSLKLDGFEVIILDDTRFKDRYQHANLTIPTETHTEDTLNRVYNILGRYTKDEALSRNIVTDLQNEGILFRERV